MAALSRRLQRGLVVVLPTETQYALAADATNKRAVATVRRIKGRPFDQPFSVFLPCTDDLERWGVALPPAAGLLAAAFWPGPLTLLLPTRNPILARLGQRGSIGIRVSSEPIIASLLRALPVPLVATSANPSGRNLDPRDENRWLANRAASGELVWARPGRFIRRQASTIVDCRGPDPRQLRAGPISERQWRAALAVHR
ncbi:MAG: threonylcarbamoyl-AMP synthase [candidate division Zixibacteria bacterium]|nr:threonylcarbamoyl-AMP synthase [candidate division Zixibacteria bacterium]